MLRLNDSFFLYFCFFSIVSEKYHELFVWGGTFYEQHWSDALYGFTTVPLDYLEKIEPIVFERIGDTKERAIGDQMRSYLHKEGTDYTELMCFANYAGGIDVYLRVSTWAVDTWQLYKITDQSAPEDWHKSMTMRYHSKMVYTIDDVYEAGGDDNGTKRKAEDAPMEDDAMVKKHKPEEPMDDDAMDKKHKPEEPMDDDAMDKKQKEPMEDDAMDTAGENL